jgi:hypothetical protein
MVDDGGYVPKWIFKRKVKTCYRCSVAKFEIKIGEERVFLCPLETWHNRNVIHKTETSTLVSILYLFANFVFFTIFLAIQSLRTADNFETLTSRHCFSSLPLSGNVFNWMHKWWDVLCGLATQEAYVPHHVYPSRIFN